MLCLVCFGQVKRASLQTHPPLLQLCCPTSPAHINTDMCRYGKHPEKCIVNAVNWGGDADTVGAIVGAQMGALHGTAWIPEVKTNKLVLLSC